MEEDLFKKWAYVYRTGGSEIPEVADRLIWNEMVKMPLMALPGQEPKAFVWFFFLTYSSN